MQTFASCGRQLEGAAAAGLAVTPPEVIPLLFYPYLLAVCALGYIATWGNR